MAFLATIEWIWLGMFKVARSHLGHFRTLLIIISRCSERDQTNTVGSTTASSNVILLDTAFMTEEFWSDRFRKVLEQL